MSIKLPTNSGEEANNFGGVNGGSTNLVVANSATDSFSLKLFVFDNHPGLADLSIETLKITLFDTGPTGAVNSNNHAANLFASGTSGSSTEITIPYSEFPSIDFTRVTTIKLELTPNSSDFFGRDFVFTSLSVVPEPSTYLMFGTLFLSVISYNKWQGRKKSAA